MQKQYVISREQMYQLDQRTMQEFPISSQVLMEIAGLKATQKIVDLFPINKYRYLILTNHGNNSGDGFVIARWLKNMSADVEILFLGDEQKMSPETKNNYQLCKKLECQFISLEELSNNQILPNTLVIDSLFGIGFQGLLKEPFYSLITEINNLNLPRVSIDIPSGMNANTGEVKLAFKADYTFTMAAVKQGMLLNAAPFYCGKIDIIDISIPDKYFQDLDSFSTVHTKMQYPKRFKHSHKSNYGKILIIAGSPGFSGAAILSAKACIKAGAGLVKLIHPKGMEPIFESALTEVMTIGNTIESDIDEYLTWSDALLIGPGLGQGKEAEHLLNRVLKYYTKPLVVDADGINLLAKNKQLILRTKAQLLLTPHIGEFSRLCAKTVDEIQKDLLKHARRFIKEFPISLLIKSSNTLYIDKNQAIFNVSGNDGLSTGGSGDVLAGIIISLIGQKMELADAAINGSFYLGKLAEKMSESQETFSLIPTEIINNIGKINIKS